ncbi:NADH-quinone oxidoreductase subunit C [Flectobacillus longus]|uniref:NADH-quinone oxidoreductase subunit C n=1 Tax=Flectobacillus longus TaxID=2984207 RepID=UPI0024B681CB|nr:NADH-quinone oxidoreductase subunit C [Flectobacillus longus]MDI9878171.1 NADH-quinone oxidoreductase subunit C [Flectobacillus longus]
MTFDQINDLIVSELGSDIILGKDHQCLHITTDKIAVVAKFLFENENCYFDMLSCITALDNGVEKATMEVIYNLYSIPYEHKMMLKVIVPRNAKDEPAPSVLTLSHIWRTADWHEREAFDLVGIRFEGHPDLRRILLPEDWDGHPLRKDYQAQEYYHGIQVKY